MKKIIILSAVLLSILAVSVFTLLPKTPKLAVNNKTTIIGSELIESSILNDPKELLKEIFNKEKYVNPNFKSITSLDHYKLTTKSNLELDYFSFPKTLVTFDDSKFTKPYLILEKAFKIETGNNIELDNGIKVNTYKVDTDFTYLNTKPPMFILSEDLIPQLDKYKTNDSKDYKVKVIEFNTIEQKKEFDKSIAPLN
jgi:hypothetical protein